MNSTNRIKNFKDINSQIEIIDLINTWKDEDIVLYKEDLFSAVGKIIKQGKQILIEINDLNFPHFDDFEYKDNIHAKIGSFEFLIDSFVIDTSSLLLDKSNVEIKIDGSLNIIRSLNFKKERSKYRCFIPTEISKLHSFHYQFETVTYQDNKTEYFYDCLRVNVDNSVFDIVQVKNGRNGYYLIESLQEIDFESFHNYCFSINQSLGFITGHMPGSEEFIFSENVEFYYCNYIRPQLDSLYIPLNWNPYSILYEKKEIAEKYMNELTRLQLKEFSKLVSLIHNNQELSASILLILEASSIHSYIIIPGVFSVVVESLARIISQDETGKEYPVENTIIADSLINDLIRIVDGYSENISPEGILKIKRRINEINKPIVKEHLTNSQKLTLPFEQLNIELSLKDIEAIEHRNDLLHGNILLTNKELKSVTDINNYMGYISGKLFTLISALILKYAGYEGYIINHAKFFEDLCDIYTEEEYFRLI